MRYLLLVLSVLSFPVFAAPSGDPTINIRTSVTSTLTNDRPNIRGDFKINDKVSVGAEVGNQSYDDNAVRVKGFGGGLYTTLYTRGAFHSGWMVDFGVTYTNLKGEATVGGITRSNDVNSLGVSVRGGYHWFWDPFNLSLGIGYASNSEDDLRIKDNTGVTVANADLNPVSMAFDFSIGLSF